MYSQLESWRVGREFMIVILGPRSTDSNLRGSIETLGHRSPKDQSKTV